MAKNGESVPYISKQNGVPFFWGGYSIYIYVYICLIMSQVSRGVSNSYSSINKPDINLYL